MRTNAPMALRTPALALVLALVGCSTGRDDSGRPEPTEPALALMAPVLELSGDLVLPYEDAWMYSPPEMSVEEFVRGERASVAVIGAPVGAEITIYVTEVGMGQGHCVLGTTLCTELLEPTVYAELVADDLGNASVGEDVPKDEPITVRYLQAFVRDPATGTATWTPPVQRHVMLSEDEATVRLEKVTKASGIGLFETGGNSHTGGVAWIDYNGDYWPDLVVGNGAWFARGLFRNNGDGTFTDVSLLIEKADLEYEDAAPLFADIENDGDDDLLFVADSPVPVSTSAVLPVEGGPNQLFLNQGGVFEEVGLERGIVDPDGHRNICGGFADYDRDGFVDLFLGEWALNTLPDGTLDNWDHTLRNTGDGSFESTTHLTGADGYGRDTLACLWMDIDLDAWPDLYIGHVNEVFTAAELGVGNPEADDVIYRNRGDGTFEDVTAASPGLGDDAWADMGVDIGDIENDGDWDFYVSDRWDSTDPYPRGNPLYVNKGDGTFTDNACDVAGVCTGYASWPVSFADFDRDGWIDLFVGTGKSWDVDLLYVNDRDGTFTAHAQPEFEDNSAHGGAVADYDGDGDVDLYVWNKGGSSHLYQNVGKDDHAWIELLLFGTDSNRSAIDALVRVTVGDTTQMRRVSGGDSAHSQSERIVHFGVGQADDVDIEITWPSGAVRNYTDVPTGTLWFIDEDLGILSEAVTGDATWSAATQELTVSLTSSFGGRTGFEVTDYGQLTYDPESITFEGTFPAPEAPTSIELTTTRGSVRQMPVVAIP